MSLNILEITLKKYWGYNSFRDNQEEIIKNILEKKDSLILMPTGAGKSLCYQLPAILSDGLTIVISPLIALMEEQVQDLRDRNIPTGLLTGSLLPPEHKQVVKKIDKNIYKLLYLSPEQLNSRKILEVLEHTNISRIILDEVHCISLWGNDFRPEYKNFVLSLKNYKIKSQIVALTATANLQTRKELINILNLENPYVYVSSFDRENIYIGTKRFFTTLGKNIALKNILKESNKAIIYCKTRDISEELVEDNKKYLKNSAYYHAGMTSEKRNEIQHLFANGGIKYLFATSAFGMGINIEDIDTVIYWNIPDSLDSYYQGIGRAGRKNNLSAVSYIFYSYDDYRLQKRFIQEEIPNLDLLKNFLKDLKNNEHRANLKNKYCLSENLFNFIITSMKQENLVNLDINSKELKKKLLDIENNYKKLINNKKQKLKEVKKFIFKNSCKRKILLNYFDEFFESEKCNNCSSCKSLI